MKALVHEKKPKATRETVLDIVQKAKASLSLAFTTGSLPF